MIEFLSTGWGIAAACLAYVLTGGVVFGAFIAIEPDVDEGAMGMVFLLFGLLWPLGLAFAIGFLLVSLLVFLFKSR